MNLFMISLIMVLRLFLIKFKRMNIENQFKLLDAQHLFLLPKKILLLRLLTNQKLNKKYMKNCKIIFQNLMINI